MTEIPIMPDAEIELELSGRVGVSAMSGADERLVREIVRQAIAGIEHGELSGRECEGQHPISAVAGLERELERIPEPAEALTNFELEELLK